MPESKPYPVPVLGFAAFSGTGKTTMLENLIPRLAAAGLRVGLIKLSHHDFEIDVPGKDSYRLRKAGANQTLVASRYRWALIGETPRAARPPTLAKMLQCMQTDELDLVLLEGGRDLPIAKIELHRPSLGRPLLCATDPAIIAVASDAPLSLPEGVEALDMNDLDSITDFIVSVQSDRVESS